MRELPFNQLKSAKENGAGFAAFPGATACKEPSAGACATEPTSAVECTAGAPSAIVVSCAWALRRFSSASSCSMRLCMASSCFCTAGETCSSAALGADAGAALLCAFICEAVPTKPTASNSAAPLPGIGRQKLGHLLFEIDQPPPPGCGIDSLGRS